MVQWCGVWPAGEWWAAFSTTEKGRPRKHNNVLLRTKYKPQSMLCICPMLLNINRNVCLYLPNVTKYRRHRMLCIYPMLLTTVDREIFVCFLFRVLNFCAFNFRHRRKRRKLNAQKLHVPFARAKFSRVKFSPPARVAKIL